MKLIPVLDLLGGRAVRATGGLPRRDYPPLSSVLAPSGELADLAAALRRALGPPSAVYVADLDAIEGRAGNRAALETLQQAGLTLWLDVGLTGAASFSAWRQALGPTTSSTHWVAGLESLTNSAALQELLDVVGVERLVFSLDLREGQPLAGLGWEGRTAWEVACVAIELGVRRMIVLDLATVGRGAGPSSSELCARLLEFSDLELVTGGGIRGAQDLAALAAAGCDAVLVGAALHEGRISVDAVRRWNGEAPAS